MVHRRIFIEMRFRKYIFLVVSSLVLLSSCSRQTSGQFYQNIEPEEIQAGTVGDDDFELEVAYVGAIGHSFVYECYIKNLSGDPITIDKSQFYLEYGDGEVIFPSDGNALAHMLDKEQKKLKKQKKSATALGILGVGLTTLFGVADGAPVGEALLFSAEPIVYIFDEQRWYKRGIESIEDEMDYVRHAQFDQQVLLAGEDITRELLFATTKIKSDVTLFYNHDDISYSITFPKRLFR